MSDDEGHANGGGDEYVTSPSAPLLPLLSADLKGGIEY